MNNMGLDFKAGTWINKHGVTDKDFKEKAEEKGTPGDIVRLEQQKESYKQQKKQYKDQKNELAEKTLAGIEDPSMAVYDAAYNAGVPLAVTANIQQGVKNATTDLFASDAQIVEYYKNYDKIKEQEKAKVQAGYSKAFTREQSLEKSKASLKSSKSAIEGTYETARLEADNKDRSKKLGDSIAELGDFSGSIVDDALDFLT